MTVDAEKDFVAIGQLASRLREPVRRIEQAADRLKLQPSLRLNHVPYYDGPAVERLTEELTKRSE